MKKVLLTGASGLIGSFLKNLLEENSYQVKPLPGKNIEQIELVSLEGFDILIHLAGENISGLWTKKKKYKIYQSRVANTQILAKKIQQIRSPPSVIISASAMGYYGSDPDKIFTEQDLPGNGFLPDLCVQWEAPFKDLNYPARVIFTRFSHILSEKGGILPAYKIMTKLLGRTILGDGKQWMSYIALEDAARAILHLIENQTLSGPFNIASSQPMQQKEFAQKIAQSLGIKRCCRIPAKILLFFFGNMAQELLLSSTKASNNKLVNSGFVSLI